MPSKAEHEIGPEDFDFVCNNRSIKTEIEAESILDRILLPCTEKQQGFKFVSVKGCRV